jgi:DNA-binding response OmpR family regulator
MKVLIADDERILANMQKELLRANRIDADIVFDGIQAIDNAINNTYDLIILDIMMAWNSSGTSSGVKRQMPEIDVGYEVLKRIREQKITTPILMLSAKSEIDDKVKGRDYGADDYLTKPFATQELIARIKALTRRNSNNNTNNQIKWQDLILDKDTYILSCDGKVKLSNLEFKIMEQLLLHKGKIINKDFIIEKVWDMDNNSCYNGIEVYISFLRKKLLAIKSKVEIKSIRGVGYFLRS